MSVNFGGILKPLAGDNTFPLLEDTNVLGGSRVAATHASRNLIDVRTLKVGCSVTVNDSDGLGTRAKYIYIGSDPTVDASWQLDSLGTGGDAAWKKPVHVRAVGASGFTYNNGAGTLTGGSNASINGGALLDLQTLTFGGAAPSQVLFLEEGVGSGLYDATRDGNGTSLPPLFTRSANANAPALLRGMIVEVLKGPCYGGRFFALPKLAGDITLGTTDLSWPNWVCPDGGAILVKPTFEVNGAATTTLFSVPLLDDTRYKFFLEVSVRDHTTNEAEWEAYETWSRKSGSAAGQVGQQKGAAPWVDAGLVTVLNNTWVTSVAGGTSNFSTVYSLVTSAAGKINVDARLTVVRVIPLVLAP